MAWPCRHGDKRRQEDPPQCPGGITCRRELAGARNRRDNLRGRQDLTMNSALGLKWAQLVWAIEWFFEKGLRTKMGEKEEGNAVDKMVRLILL